MGKIVLVADDSPTIRKIVELSLAGQGIQVLGAATGAEAVELLRRKVPDLVIADAVMPAPDGYTLCETIKDGEFGACPPVVLLADVLQPIDGGRAAGCGADAHLAKPFEATKIRALVADQLGVQLPPEPVPASPLKPFTPQIAASRMAAGGDTLEPISKAAAASLETLSEKEMNALAQRIVRMMSDTIVREVAWEVVPEMSELLIKERMQSK